jgi:hypothetical protein
MIVRIDDNYLKGNRKDGELITSYDFNELENIVKTAINANFDDIQNIDSKYIEVDEKIKILTQFNIETINNMAELDDGIKENKEEINKLDDGIKENKEEINKLKENISNNDVPLYYFDGLNNQENVNMFNEICNLFTDGAPFVLFGKFQVEIQTGEDTFEMEEVVTPIQVKNFTDREFNGDTQTMMSFTTPPIWIGGMYKIASIILSGGAWGEYTEIQSIGWSEMEAPSNNLKTFEGYDVTKNQVLKNINGVLTWVEE